MLCDPWFSEAYEGAWAQWPRIENPLDVCGPADYVYISHVHPDHYDPGFLKQYLTKYPQAKVIVAEHDPPLLSRKLQSRGMDCDILINPRQRGETCMYTIANRANSGINIDSALLVYRKGLSVANLNDNPFDEEQVKFINEVCGGHPTVALLPFVGAGPWPQCYHFDNPADQRKAAEAKKQKYLDLFARYRQALQPNVAVPFAGQYWLHGPQIDLNPLRGMADATECVPRWKHVWVPADGGQSTLTLKNDQEWDISSEREYPYDWPTVGKALQYQDDKHSILNNIDYIYRYEREILVPVERLPLLKLLQSAHAKAWKQFKGGPILHLYINAEPLPQWFYITNQGGPVIEVKGPSAIEPRIEVHLDARHLFGMLTRLYNANSVRIGSLCRFKCVPNVYDKELDDLFGEYWDSLRV